MNQRIARLLIAKATKSVKAELQVSRPILRTVEGEVRDHSPRTAPGVIGDCTRGGSKPQYKRKSPNVSRIAERNAEYYRELSRQIRANNSAKQNPIYAPRIRYNPNTTQSGYIYGQWPVGTADGHTQSILRPAKVYTDEQKRIIRATAALTVTNEYTEQSQAILNARALVAFWDDCATMTEWFAAKQSAKAKAHAERLKAIAITARGGQLGDQDVIYRAMGRLGPIAAAAPKSGIVARFRFQPVTADSPEFAFTPRIPLASLVPLARPKVMAAGRY